MRAPICVVCKYACHWTPVLGGCGGCGLQEELVHLFVGIKGYATPQLLQRKLPSLPLAQELRAERLIPLQRYVCVMKANTCPAHEGHERYEQQEEHFYLSVGHQRLRIPLLLLQRAD